MAFPQSEHPDDAGTYGQTSALRIPWAGSITYDDLQGFAEDGHRYELYNGMLIVNAAPNFGHQIAVSNLLRRVFDAMPEGCAVLPAPFDWKIDEGNSFEPDVVVVNRADTEMKRNHVLVPPVLAVEVLSPSTRYYDLGLKRMAYAEFGLEDLWFVDVDVPKVTALRLDRRTGEYVEEAAASGDEELQVERPFAISVVPARLLD